MEPPLFFLRPCDARHRADDCSLQFVRLCFVLGSVPSCRPDPRLESLLPSSLGFCELLPPEAAETALYALGDGTRGGAGGANELSVHAEYV